MTTIEADWTGHAERLAKTLWDRGDIRSPEWRAAIAAVPRHVFVPEAYEQDDTARWIRRATAGDWERVYSPRTLVTALTDRGGYQEPASSSTNPELMARMLETLDIQDGQRALEIGTGTGYQAGLLCHRLGDRNVFSVDIDPDLVALARQRLASIGYRPTLAALDGELGFADHQPYDHLIATCSVPAVPRAWGAQLAPGGGILVDLKLAISAGNLVHLRRHEHRLEGRFTSRWGSFMAMRYHADQHPPIPPVDPDESGERRYRTQAPTQPWREAPVVWFLAQLRLPRGVIYGALLDPDTRQPTAATMTAPDGSWAKVDLTDRTVTEAGNTPLWEPVEWAYRLWLTSDRPGWNRLGLTVDAAGRNQVWIDEPDGSFLGTARR